MAAATTIIAGVGAAISAGGTIMSFTQAAKQQGLQRQAEAKAAQAMQEARNKLEVNFYDQLAIQKEPYELQREAALVQGAQAIQAAQEGDRGAAAAAGRVQMAQNEAQAGIRTAMGKELSDLERLSATEESRLRDINVQLDMGEIAGQQQIAADAQQAQAAAMMEGFQGLSQTAKDAAGTVKLFTGGGKKTTNNTQGVTGQQSMPMNNNQNDFLFNNYRLNNFNQNTQQPNYQFGASTPPNLGGTYNLYTYPNTGSISNAYDPFNLFK
jgi:hypothetical protein